MFVALTARTRTRTARNNEELERKTFLQKADNVTTTKSIVSATSPSTWLTVYIASALSFINSAQYTMYFTILWPYLKKLDGTTTETFFGYIVASYSAGQIVSSPLFGYWSNKIRQVQLPIIVGMLLMFAGNVIYLMLQYVTIPGSVLLISRLISGMGSGNIVLMRSYAATAVDESDRPRALTYVTCGQAVGLTIGPALLLIFRPIPEFDFPMPFIENFHVNIFTLPTIFSNFANFFGTIAMIWFFQEKFIGITEEADGKEKTKHQATLPSYDLIAVSVCLITRFTYMFINTNLETIGLPYSMMMFNWPGDGAVHYNAWAQGIVGFLTLLVYVILICFKLDKRINYRIGSIIGLAVMILFHVLTYSWPFFPGQVTMNATMTNRKGEIESIGCNAEKFHWCESLKPVNVWFYYSSYVLALGLAFPILNIGNTTLFAGILGPRRQGTQQGILQMCGGTARLVGPIIISVLYSEYGPTVAWLMEIIVISLTLMLWFTFFHRLVPLIVTQTVDSFHDVSVVDVAPDPSALSSSSQVHSVPRKIRSDVQQGYSDPTSLNSYMDPPKQPPAAVNGEAPNGKSMLKHVL